VRVRDDRIRARCGGSVASSRTKKLRIKKKNKKKEKKREKGKGKFKIVLNRSRPIDSGYAASCVEINGYRRATRIDIRVPTLKKKALGRGARLSPIMDRRERGNNQRECPSQASTW
jgi:hypothetical protein